MPENKLVAPAESRDVAPENSHLVAPASSPAVVRASRPHVDQPSAERKVELKFCECCGGLWLRHEGSRERYCTKCAPVMRQFAVPRKKPCASVKAVSASSGRFLCA